MTDTPAKKPPAKRAQRGVTAAARAAREKVMADTKDAIAAAAQPNAEVPESVEAKANEALSEMGWPTLTPEQWAEAFKGSPGPMAMTLDEWEKLHPVNVHELWCRVMDTVKSVEKGDYNKDQHFRFRGIDAVMEAVGPALRQHKVHVRPRRILEHSATEYTTKNNTRMVNRVVRVEWEVTGPQGDSFVGESMGEAADAGDKSLTKAQSVAYRVFLLNALTIPTGDPDPDAESHERATPSEREQAIQQASARSYASREEYERERAAAAQQPPSQEQDGQGVRHQAQAGEENQAAQADTEEARREMWRVAKGLGWQWPNLVSRFRSDHGMGPQQSDAATIQAFTTQLVKEAEEEEDRAVNAAEQVLGAKEIAPPDEAQAGGIL